MFKVEKETTTLFKVLLIDTANTHTSAMAEGILKKKLPNSLKPKVSISSVGVYANRYRGAPCTIEVISSGKAFGVDLSKHKSTYVTREMLQNADCIVAMDKINLEIMEATVPSNEIVILSDFQADKTIDEIPDPANQNDEFYNSVWRLLDECIDNFIEYLNKKLNAD